MYGDRMRVDDQLLPSIDRTLRGTAGDATTMAGSVARLAQWAAANATLQGAAASLREAQRALNDTGTHLAATHRDVVQRAGLLGPGAAATQMPAGTHGKEPDPENPFDAPFYYWKTEDHTVQGGARVLHWEPDSPGDTFPERARMGGVTRPFFGNGTSLDLASITGKAGELEDDGSNWLWGAEGAGQVASGELVFGHQNPLNLASVEGQLAQANAEVSGGEGGFTVGAGATAAGGAVTFGRLSANRSYDDTQVRFGGGLGVGFTARGHWGDEDHDGVREDGFGLDIGVLSFDLKAEREHFFQ